MTNPSQPQWGQTPATPPQFGQPAAESPSQFGQPAAGSPSQFGQPASQPTPHQVIQPGFGKSAPAQSGFGAPEAPTAASQTNPYATSPYQQTPSYGQDPYDANPYGFSGLRAARPARSNPVAGALLLLGGILAVLACFIEDPYGVTPLISSIDHLPSAIDYADTPGGWRILLLVAYPTVLAAGTLICVISAFLMFSKGPHGGAAGSAVFGALLMLAAAVMLVVGTDASVFDHLDTTTTLALAAWLPALAGASAGFRK